MIIPKFKWINNTDTAILTESVTLTISPKELGYWEDQGNRAERRKKAKELWIKSKAANK